jgi:hypothetical protein
MGGVSPPWPQPGFEPVRGRDAYVRSPRNARRSRALRWGVQWAGPTLPVSLVPAAAHPYSAVCIPLRAALPLRAGREGGPPASWPPPPRSGTSLPLLVSPLPCVAACRRPAPTPSSRRVAVAAPVSASPPRLPSGRPVSHLRAVPVARGPRAPHTSEALQLAHAMIVRLCGCE